MDPLQTFDQTLFGAITGSVFWGGDLCLSRKTVRQRGLFVTCCIDVFICRDRGHVRVLTLSGRILYSDRSGIVLAPVMSAWQASLAAALCSMWQRHSIDDWQLREFELTDSGNHCGDSWQDDDRVCQGWQMRLITVQAVAVVCICRQGYACCS